MYFWFLFSAWKLDATSLSVASFLICLCLALGTIETERAGCKIRPLISKEQGKQAVKRVDVTKHSNFASPVFLS